MKKILMLMVALAAFCAAIRAQDVDMDTKYATEMLQKGAAVPTLVMNDLDGKPRSLKDFRGKYVVLDFWATWCPDCRQDVPEMKRLYAKYASDKVVFVGISFDTDRDKLVSYVAENEIPWLQLSDFQNKKESPVSQAFQVKWIPSLYLVDPKGRVVLGTVMIEKLGAELGRIR